MSSPKKDGISNLVIKRLPRYYRFIGELIKQGTTRISSGELAKRMSLTASQIRQDLNCFGGFGQQGYGYNLIDLQTEIGKILGVSKGHKTILIGAGNLGKAIANHMEFDKHGCDLVAIFDSDLRKANENVAGIRIKPIKELDSFCESEEPVIAILCIPKEAAQQLADKLVSLGIKGFWNFSHYDLAIDHENIVVKNVHLGDSLMMLCYGVTHLD